jgi:hypothetical protein
MFDSKERLWMRQNGPKCQRTSRELRKGIGLSISGLSVLGMTLSMTDPHRASCTIGLVQLKRLVHTHVSSTLDSPSLPVFLWLCKIRTFFATMKFSLTLAVALLPAIFVNAQYSDSARPVTTTRPVTASPVPSASPSSTVPPSNSTYINVSAVLSLATIYR